MTSDLFTSGTERADANGRAVITLQPLRAFEKWNVRRMTVQSTSQRLVPTVRVYRGSEIATRIIDGTYTGTLDHSDTDIRLQSGEAIVFAFEGADVGSICVATIEGDTVKE